MRIHPALDAGHGLRPLGEQLARHGERASIKRGRIIDDLMHQAQRARSGRIERFRSERHCACTAAGVATQRGQADRRAQADAMHGIREASARPRDHDIACRDERAATRERGTLHGCHDGAGQGAQRAHSRGEPLQEHAHRGGVGHACAKVETAAESATGRGQQHARRSRPSAHGCDHGSERRIEFIEHRSAERVATGIVAQRDPVQRSLVEHVVADEPIHARIEPDGGFRAQVRG